MIEIQSSLVCAAQAGSSEAVQDILDTFHEALSQMARSKAKRQGGDVEDLHQAGSISLWKAITNWPGDRPFVPYAIKYIDGAMKHELRGSTNQHELGRFVSLDAVIGDDSFSLLDTIEDAKSVFAVDSIISRESDCQLERRERAKLCLLHPEAKGFLLQMELGKGPCAILRSRGRWSRNGAKRLQSFVVKAATREPPSRQCSYPFVWTIPKLLIVASHVSGRGCYEDIAHLLNTSVTAVRSAAAHAGIKASRHLKRHDEKTIQSMAVDGRTPREIANRLNCSTETIRVRLRRMGVAPDYCKVRWRNNPKRKKAAIQKTEKRQRRQREQAQSLVRKELRLAAACTLEALHLLGQGDRQDVADKVVDVCVAHGWKPIYTGWQSALRWLKILREEGAVTVLPGASTEKRQFILTRPRPSRIGGACCDF